MIGPVNVSIGLVTGFAFGALVGFMWSQGAKSSLSKHTRTTVDSRTVTVQVDYMAAARDGLIEALNS